MASTRRGRRVSEAEDVQVNGGALLNVVCPLSQRRVAALEEPVQDKLGYIYDRAAVTLFIKGGKGGTGKQAAHPVARAGVLLTLRELRCARALVAAVPASGQAEVIVLGGESEDEEPAPPKRRVPAARATPPQAAASSGLLRLGERCLRYSRTRGCDVEGKLVRLLDTAHGLFLDGEDGTVRRKGLNSLFTLRGRTALSSLKLPEAGQSRSMLAVPTLVQRYLAQNPGTFESAVVVESTFSDVRLYVRSGPGAGKLYNETKPGWCLIPV